MIKTDSAPYFVYIVRCCDGTLYTGCTHDVTKRIARHNKHQGAKYTRSRTPVVLVYSQGFPTWLFAAREEARIKRLTKKEKDELICS